MSYEYKALIEQAIIDDDRPLDWEEGFKELDEVYAQAAKADEYEAKAKAFDQTKETLKEDVEKLEKLEKDFPLSCQDELENLNNILVLMTRYESGEPYVKK